MNEHDVHSGDSLPMPEPPARETGSALWLFYLFLSPRRFFDQFERTATTFSTAYASLIVGIGAVMDRISRKVTQYEFSGRSRLPEDLLDSWSVYWTTCVAMGVVSAVLYWAIGGWWYRVRLVWSGAPSPDACLARRVYIFASLIVYLPLLLEGIVAGMVHATPRDAEFAGSWLGIAVVVLLFFSVLVSYRGVRTLFEVTRWKARLWFLVLPTVVYGGAMAVAIGLMAFAMFGGLAVPPDTEHPRSIDRRGFSLQYPGNWAIDRADEDYDPDWYFSIEPMQDALVVFQFGGPTLDLQAENDELMAGYRTGFSGGEVKTFDRWGSYEGAGAEFRGHVEGATFLVRVFTTSTEFSSFSVVEILDVVTADSVEPGVELIRRTFRLKD